MNLTYTASTFIFEIHTFFCAFTRLVVGHQFQRLLKCFYIDVDTLPISTYISEKEHEEQSG